MVVSFFLVHCHSSEFEEGNTPNVLDSRLSLELVANNPQIVTPIGLAIDDRDQLYVLESHTHSPPSDYSGPAFDKIKKGVDTNQDGIPESWIIYADSITDGMNLAFGPNNTLFLVQKDQVVAYQDTDGDGTSDRSNRLLTMQTPRSVYDHAGILGITYAPNGWLYISRGNTSSLAWRIEGTDGSTIEGYGDGGSVFRCRTDGSKLQEVATGFWNPFDIKFTNEGRLLLVDNDPDSRGPNRLVDVTFGGNYGYESLYGGSGIHPFLAWNGELPGTLPYAAGLGEAPSGLIDASFTSFPPEYKGNIISTIWEENNLVRIPLHITLSTVTGVPEIILQGDSTFHPVALATNSRGDLYITDWVVRQYPNHGQGKIWRLRSEGKQPLTSPLTADEVATGILHSRVGDNRDVRKLTQALTSNDLFVRANARYVMQDSSYFAKIQELVTHEDPTLRSEGVLIATEATPPLPKSVLRNLLRDENETVKKVALMYVARRLREDVRPEVEGMMTDGAVSPSLLETYLATLRHLQPSFIQNYQNQTKPESKKLLRDLPPSYLSSLIKNPAIAEETKAIALTHLDNPGTILPFLLKSLPSASPPLQSSILQASRSVRSDSTANAILNVVLDQEANPTIRGEALVALEYQPGTFCDEVASLLSESQSVLTETAVAYLCRCQGEDIEQKVVQFASTNEAAKARWEYCRTSNSSTERPSSDDQWLQAINDNGNPARGKLVFQSITSQCQSCHKIDGWGSIYGPDLSNIGSSKSAHQLALAILEPSAEIAPEWQGWYVADSAGVRHLGRQIDVGSNSVELMDMRGEFVTYGKPQSYGPLTSSLMPNGLENTLTSAEFNDLIAYLTSLK